MFPEERAYLTSYASQELNLTWRCKHQQHDLISWCPSVSVDWPNHSLHRTLPLCQWCHSYSLVWQNTQQKQWKGGREGGMESSPWLPFQDAVCPDGEVRMERSKGFCSHCICVEQQKERKTMLTSLSLFTHSSTPAHGMCHPLQGWVIQPQLMESG